MSWLPVSLKLLFCEVCSANEPDKTPERVRVGFRRGATVGNGADGEIAPETGS